MDTETRALSELLITEIFHALGFSKTGQARRIFGPLFRKLTDRFAGISLDCDRRVAQEGFAPAAAWMLAHWCDRVIARGTETIPRKGPLLVISNHAGTYDTFVITAELGREDLKLISSGIPFLKSLPNASNHIIYLSDETRDRMTAARAGIRHLQSGGALLLYGTGRLDPDPEIYPDAEQHLEQWSSSIDLFLRMVPEANVLITIVSGVLSKGWSRSPITWLRRIEWQKQSAAEFGQVLQQLMLPGRLYLTPRLTFDTPVTVKALHEESQTDRFLPALIDRAKKLMAEHMTAAVKA